MLLAAGPVMDRCRFLVTFNGRRFDVPLLCSRFTCTRLPTQVDAVAHLDLLYPARSLWRERLPSCALSVLEGEILGVARSEDDVPGWMIPQLYFDYVTNGRAEPLRQVFYHNAQDILSMVTLTAYLCRAFADPFGGHLTLGSEFYRLGRIYEGVGMHGMGIRAYDRALRDDLRPHARLSALERIGILYKRMGRWNDAVSLWQQQLGGNSIVPYVELAKYYEHRAQDHRRAQDLVLQALTLVQAPEAGYTPDVRKHLMAELSHRRQRLERKLGRIAPCRPSSPMRSAESS